MLTSTETDLLATALSAAQGELADAAKSSFNPGFKSKYADLAEVLQTIRPIAAKHGLSFVQGVAYTEGSPGLAKVVTRLMHKSGQYVMEELAIPVTKKDAQGLGSAFTYGRRYSIAAFFGIAQDDDDGTDASPRGKEAKAKPSPPQTQGPVNPSPIAQALVDRFKTATEDDMVGLVSEYATLTAAEQTQVLGPAKAARLRIDAAKVK